MQFTRASSQYLLVPYNANMAFTTGFSICAWVNPSSATMQRVCSRMTTASTDTEIFGLDVFQANARIMMGKVTMGGLFGNTPTYSVDTAAGGSVPAGTWSHIVGTWDGANMRVYVNGVLANTVARTGTLLAASSPLSVGADYLAANNIKEFFDGMMEDLRLYNRALTANEIQTMWKLHGADGMVSNLVLSLPMSDGTIVPTMAASTVIKDVGPFGTSASTAVAGMKYGYNYMQSRWT